MTRSLIVIVPPENSGGDSGLACIVTLSGNYADLRYACLSLIFGIKHSAPCYAIAVMK